MNNYILTILYTRCNAQPGTPPDISFGGLPADRVQLIPVVEDDPYHPRRNALDAIPKAEGEFTIFLDEEDSFDVSFLERMLEEARRPEASFVMPALNSPYQKSGQPSPFLLPKAGDCRIDTTRELPVFPMDLHGLMISTKRLQRAYGQSEDSLEQEKQILLLLLGENPVFFYLGSCTCLYKTPKECDFSYDIRCLTHEWYYAPFEQFLLPLLEKSQKQDGEVGLLLQHMALYMIQLRIKANTNNNDKHVISRKELPAYLELLSRVLAYVGTKVLLSTVSQPVRSGLREQLLYLRLKKSDFSYYPDLEFTSDTINLTCDGVPFCTLANLALRVCVLEYRNGCLELDGEINDFFHGEKLSVYAELEGARFLPVYNSRYSLVKCFGVTYSRMKTFHVSIPVPPAKKERVLRFFLCAGGRKYRMGYEFPSHTSRFNKNLSYAYWRFGDYLSYWKRDGIHIIRSKKLLVLYKELRLWKQMWTVSGGKYREQLPLKMLNFLLRPYFSRQRIWLFFDKIYKGGDSSEYIYRYASAQKDGIRKYYLLDKSSADYKRMKREGYSPLVRGSLKHRLIFLNANMIIASNSTIFAFNDYTFERSLPIRGDVHFDVACVQHGMSVQKIALAQQRLRDNISLYFCASKYEIKNLLKPVYDYEGYDILKLTGVPRYDGLKDRAGKVLLISPTWRMNSALPVTKNEGVSRDYNPNFRETSYFRVYNSLINDPRLLANARKYGYRIQYVLHPIVSPQHDDFTKNDLVEIIPSIGDMSYEKLFCEAALMVTDFSGVQFDFAYMRKPVVYLHHDDIPQHYEEGTFYYDTMAFGEICHTNDELIDVLCEYMKNGCKMPEIYRKRADDFFEFSDNRNCERIYPVMLAHERNRK